MNHASKALAAFIAECDALGFADPDADINGAACVDAVAGFLLQLRDENREARRAHTPGPWTLDERTIKGARADCYPLLFEMIHATDADARLVTLAPDMLEALRDIALTEACSNSDPDVMGDALDNAVATAQGILARFNK